MTKAEMKAFEMLPRGEQVAFVVVAVEKATRARRSKDESTAQWWEDNAEQMAAYLNATR